MKFKAIPWDKQKQKTTFLPSGHQNMNENNQTFLIVHSAKYFVYFYMVRVRDTVILPRYRNQPKRKMSP